MKKIFISAIFLFFSGLTAFTQGFQPVQIVTPPKIFTGEKVSISYTFYLDDFGLENDENFCTESAVNLLSQYSDVLSVEEASLVHNGSQHTLFLTLFLWTPGNLHISPFNIGPAVIELNDIQVFSILEQTKSDSLKPFVTPMLIPGTTWMIYTAIILAFILIIGLIVFLLRFERIAKFLKTQRHLGILKRNARKTIKHLKQIWILQSDFSDSKFCEKVQNTIRIFIENRFKSNFRTWTTSKIYENFEEYMGGKLEKKQEELIEKISSLFMRLDYIRFAVNIAMKNGERKQIIEESIEIVEEFEHAEL